LNFSKILPQFSKFWQKFSFQNVNKSKIFGEHGICHFSSNFFGGREIAQEGGEVLPKILPKP